VAFRAFGQSIKRDSSAVLQCLGRRLADCPDLLNGELARVIKSILLNLALDDNGRDQFPGELMVLRDSIDAGLCAVDW